VVEFSPVFALVVARWFAFPLQEHEPPNGSPDCLVSGAVLRAASSHDRRACYPANSALPAESAGLILAATVASQIF